VSGEWNSKNYNLALRNGSGVVRAFNVDGRAQTFAKLSCCLRSALCVTRTDYDMFAGHRPTHRESRSFRSSAAKDADFSDHSFCSVLN
jgi:hypothetical protein